MAVSYTHLLELKPGANGWVGRSIPRFEDAALLAGRGRYIDDLGVPPGTLQAAILRSPHAHAEIEIIDCAAARAADGVFAVLTGADIKALTSSLVVGLKAPIECWPIATDRARYVGEPAVGVPKTNAGCRRNVTTCLLYTSRCV